MSLSGLEDPAIEAAYTSVVDHGGWLVFLLQSPIDPFSLTVQSIQDTDLGKPVGSYYITRRAMQLLCLNKVQEV
jgi:hypothetical protein